MNEVTGVMQSDWAEEFGNKFEQLSSMQVMDKFYELAKQGGTSAVNNDPKNIVLIKTMAKITDAEIVTWANKMEPNHNVDTFNFFLHRMRIYRDTCRKALNLPLEPSKVQ